MPSWHGRYVFPDDSRQDENYAQLDFLEAHAPELAREIDLIRTWFNSGHTYYHIYKNALADDFVPCIPVPWEQLQLLNKDAAYGSRLLPGYSPVYYRAQLLYEHPCGFYAGPTLEWSPFKYAADLARTTFADPYALLGLKLGYRTKKGLSFYVEARNLTDETYSPTVNVVRNATVAGSTAVFLPGDGRSLYGGIEWKW